MPLPAPLEAIDKLLAHLTPVEDEAIPLAQSAGRLLASPIKSDRPSPPADVSAMDGYALRLADLNDQLPTQPIAIAGEVAIGHAPPSLPPGQAVRIFTGGAVPAEADVVIPRELVVEEPDEIHVVPGLNRLEDRHIRRAGENLASGQTVVAGGHSITPATSAALAAFGQAAPRVHRRLRVCLITTGNELLGVDASPQPWQLRDSNGPMLAALFAHVPWIHLLPLQHAPDEPTKIQSILRQTLKDADAILLTGGVSMGDHDYVPAAIEAVGGRVIFHRLALRPGKPLLGAIGPQNQSIFGLPGNPLSALITARRVAAIALRKQAGFAVPDPAPPTVTLAHPDQARLPLWWYRPVRLIEPGHAELVKTQGSGDLVAAARSDGFIEVPPGDEDIHNYSYYPWNLT